MSTAAPAATKKFRVALIGNPNTGKTTIFNALTGFRARVGNYAGVTVERKVGPLKNSDGKVELIDLPGTYSLSARSADEMIAVDVLMGLKSDEERPDLVLVVVDASNLERNLFLATQVMEVGLPVIVLLNMVDAAESGGITIDQEKLTHRLGMPVIPMVASKGRGIDELVAELNSSADRVMPAHTEVLPYQFTSAVESLREKLLEAGVPERYAENFLVRRCLLEVGGMAEQRIVREGGNEAKSAIADARKELADNGCRAMTLEAKARYGWIRVALDGVVQRPDEHRASFSDKLDAILIHKLWGTLVFALLMLVIFQAIYSWSGPLMDAIDGGFGALGELIGGLLPEGPLQAMIVDGLIAGVGGVVIFLPQILILFFFISLLEDCGYMARAAFLMDKLLSKVGLSGRSFIPMLSGFACAIPAVMATRTIEDRNDRFTTILVAPLMSCSARLPVYVLFVGAFVPANTILGGLVGLQAAVLFSMYLVGAFTAVAVALVLKKTFFKGKTPSFIMELPPYRAPQWKAVFHRMWERGVEFLKRAGTIIVAVSAIVWALTYYPRPSKEIETAMDARYAPQIAQVEAELENWLAQDSTPGTVEELMVEAEESPEAVAEGVALLERASELESERNASLQGAQVRQSFLGRMGRFIEPVVEPLGWDWRIGMGALASFPAREVIVSTLGIIYDTSGEVDEESVDLREKLQQARYEDGRPVFNLAVALSIMVFFALCAQCAATLAIIKRETNSWRWPIFTFSYMTGLAYIAALITYQIAIRLIS